MPANRRWNDPPPKPEEDPHYEEPKPIPGGGILPSIADIIGGADEEDDQLNDEGLPTDRT